MPISPESSYSGAVIDSDEFPISWRDVVDTLNPLEHIPFVSTLFDEYTGHKPSTIAKVAGDTLLGGPVGFVVSLADMIFESQTGKGVGETMVAALFDSAPTTTQLAANESQAASADAPGQEILPPLAVNDAAAKPLILASAAPVGGPKPLTNTAVLDLYGGSIASAHTSYQKAQLRPYLQDVNHSLVL